MAAAREAHSPSHGKRWVIGSLPRREQLRERTDMTPPRSWAGSTATGSSASRALHAAPGSMRSTRTSTALFEEARQVPGGALPRGPAALLCRDAARADPRLRRYRHHPWFVAVCEAVLDQDYRIVEIGFDIPFPAPPTSPGTATSRRRTPPSKERLNILAFNLTAVDTTAGAWAVRDRAGHAVGRHPRRQGRHVPRPRAVGPLHRAGGAEDAAARRHFGAFGADHPSRHGEPLERAAAGARRRRRRARRDQRQASRPAGHARLSRQLAGAGPRSPNLPSCRRARTDHPAPCDRGLARADYG